MNKQVTSQIETERTNDAQHIQDRVNGLMQMHRNENPQLEIMHIRGDLVAVIRYEVEEIITDGAADEANADGIFHQCKECPKLKRTNNKRQRFFPCEQRPSGTSLTANCCDWFYEKLRDGE